MRPRTVTYFAGFYNGVCPIKSRTDLWADKLLTTNYSDVIIVAMASQITSLKIVISTVYSGADQRKCQNSTSLAFVRGMHRWPVNSPHQGPVTRKMFQFDDVIMSPVQERKIKKLYLNVFHTPPPPPRLLSKLSRIIYYLWQMKFESRYHYIHLTNCVWKCCLRRGSHAVSTSKRWLHPILDNDSLLVINSSRPRDAYIRR